MTQNFKTHGLDFAKFLSQVPPDLRARINEQNRKEAIMRHQQFKDAFSAGRCSFCGQPLNSFDVAIPTATGCSSPRASEKNISSCLQKSKATRGLPIAYRKFEDVIIAAQISEHHASPGWCDGCQSHFFAAGRARGANGRGIVLQVYGRGAVLQM
jgi:hypothetical protein